MSIGINRENDSDMETSSAEVLLYKKMEELQKELSLDDDTIRNSWEKFQETSRNYTLEGQKLHWLACSLFTSCRNISVANSAGVKPRKKALSVTTLLRYCDLSLTLFFEYMKKWIIMNSIPNDFLEEVKTAEQNFHVCQIAYKQYVTLFNKLFIAPDSESIRQRRSATTCTPIRVFEFTWLLFILMKGKYYSCSEVLVDCSHILRCCCDISFKNVFMANLREILNPTFVGLPNNWHLPGYQMPKVPPSIIENLVEEQELADAAYLQKHRINNYLKKLMQERELKGNKEHFTDLFSAVNMESNYSSLGKLYEQYILEEGYFDEKIFLAEAYRQSVFNNISCSNGENITDTPINRRSNVLPPTPLTGRQYVGPRDLNDAAVESHSKIRVLLENYPQEMPLELREMIADCGKDVLESVLNIANNLNKKLSTGGGNNLEVNNTKLFHYLLEMILNNEKKLKKDISPLLKREIFVECIFACATELIMFAFNRNKKFPWILECLEVPAPHFVRVIELVVRCNDNFSRAMIKHLIFIEESILESLMWKNDSVLWEEIKRAEYEIPKFEEIARPGTIKFLSSGSTNTRRALFNAETAPSNNSSDIFQSPRYSNIRPGQSLLNPKRNQAPVVASPPTPIGRKACSFSILFRKFYELAGVRLDHLCTKLFLNDMELRMKIWTVIEHAIRETKLIQNRHLDQLIMCSVYAICKLIPKPDITFSKIMECYRSQPQARREVYRKVYIDAKCPSDTLITFYNGTYVLKLKSYIGKFSNHSATSIDGASLSPLPANKPLVSPRSQVTRNVYVNPLDSPTNFNSPYSYYFNRSDSRDLKTINNAINGVKRSLTDGATPDAKRFANRKLQDLIEEREVQNTI